MEIYYLNYDIKDGHDYTRLYQALSRMEKPRHLLQSLWQFQAEATDATKLMQLFRNYVEKTDSLCVIQGPDFSGVNFLPDATTAHP